MVLGMSVTREASFGGGLDAVFQEVEERLGQTGGCRVLLPWAFWDVLPLADKGILGTNGTNVHCQASTLSLKKTSSPVILTSDTKEKGRGVSESLFEQGSEEPDSGFWATGWKVISVLHLGMPS